MRLTDEELRRRYQQTGARAGGEGCLTRGELLRAAARELASPEERARVADHLIACADCAQEFRLAASLKSWAERAASGHDIAPVAPTTPSRAGLRGGRRAWLPHVAYRRAAALAALVVVALGVSLSVWVVAPRWDALEENVRGRRPSPAQVTPPDGASLAAPPERLAWPPMESAETYRVVLYDFESTQVWESEPVVGTSVILPESVREGLRQGQPYYWRVNARGVGFERRQSDLFRFSLGASGQR